MKIRNGFVSNSSSSSFTLEVGKPFKNVLEVAKYMVPKREFDNDAELVSKINKLMESKPADTVYAICFKSCNYDTYIVKMGEKFLISTCHNHEWNLDQWVTFTPAEYYEYFGESFYDLSRLGDFLHLEFDRIGRKPERYSYCDECYTDCWVIDGKTVCPSCNKEHKEKTR